jgi:thioredoxin-related protein
VKLIRVSVGSSIGRQLAGRYGLRGVPTLLVFDGSGAVVLRQVGRVSKESVLWAVGR